MADLNVEPHPQYGEAGPYALHTTRRRKDGALVSMPAVRNLTWFSARNARLHELAVAQTVESHISLDTCG